MGTSPPRDARQRKADVLENLRREVNCWVASASATGETHLIPLSYTWDGTRLTLATLRYSRTARNLQRAGWVRLALGQPSDVVILEGSVTFVRREDIDPSVAEAFAIAAGFDPRRLPAEPAYVYLSVMPRQIQAWRGPNELAGREIMTDGIWRA